METVKADASWFMQDDNKVTPVQEVISPEDQNNTTPKAEEPEVVVEEKEKEQEQVIEQKPELPSTVLEVFEQLKTNKDHNLAWYEDQKIETLEDVAEFIDINANIRYGNLIKDVDNTWYQSKSPVFQEFAKMAELAGDDITKLYGFIESQKVIDDFANLDTKEIDQAEVIIENYMRLRKEPVEVIKEELADLKERGKISERAEKYKPILVAHFESQKQQQLVQEEQNITAFYKAIEDNEKSIITFLSNKEIGGMKLKDEDKDLVYNNLAYNPEVQGFTIYKKIEDLQAQGKYDILAKAIMLIENEERFDELYTNRVRGQVAKGLRGKLKFASDTSEKQQDVVQKKPLEKGNNEGKTFNPFTNEWT